MNDPLKALTYPSHEETCFVPCNSLAVPVSARAARMRRFNNWRRDRVASAFLLSSPGVHEAMCSCCHLGRGKVQTLGWAKEVCCSSKFVAALFHHPPRLAECSRGEAAAGAASASHTAFRGLATELVGFAHLEAAWTMLAVLRNPWLPVAEAPPFGCLTSEASGAEPAPRGLLSVPFRPGRCQCRHELHLPDGCEQVKFHRS